MQFNNYAEGFGYSVVRELVGHGFGRNLHEKPEVQIMEDEEQERN